MNRVIKFRAWDKEEKKMYFDVQNNYDNIREQTCFQDNNLELMQFTGLKDKNGKEIYEGDIIKAKHDVGDYDIGSVVYGRKGAFCIDLPKVATGIKSPLLNYIHGIMFDESDIEVIGNIYENPELLK